MMGFCLVAWKRPIIALVISISYLTRYNTVAFHSFNFYDKIGFIIRETVIAISNFFIDYISQGLKIDVRV
jgi:hypothetical protein